MRKKVLKVTAICLGLFMLAGCSSIKASKEQEKPVTEVTQKDDSSNKSVEQGTNSSTDNKNSSSTSKDSLNNTTKINTTSNSGAAKSNEVKQQPAEKNSTTVQNKEPFYGQWVIKKVTGYGKAGTYSNDDIKKIVGKKLSFSKEQSSCFGDDASYLNNTVKNPIYKKSVITSDKFLKDWRVPINTLTINSNTVTEIEIDDAKGFSACTFFIKDNNTLILYGGGTFFELRRVTQNTN